jgi:CRP-like cAMP-binding protein
MSLLVSLFQYIRLPKGTVLFQEGELSPSGNSMFFLFDGSVSVLRDGNLNSYPFCYPSHSIMIYDMMAAVAAMRIDYNGNPHEVAVVEKGNVVGEVGLIIDLPRTATIVAGREDCLLLELSKHNFTSIELTSLCVLPLRLL